MVKLNKIYTRTGDDGTTGLVDGSRLPKHAARLEAIGVVDEANAALGLVAVALNGADGAGGAHAGAIARIQNDLFDLGADLATPGENFASDGALRIVSGQVDWLEQAIDQLNEALAPLTSFILPGGSEVAARVHMARTAVRRAERAATALAAQDAANPAALAYLNRLSDYLFVLGRALNDNGAADVLWVPGASRKG
jgi:cob(I)alamin adenosyltransferase